MIDSLMAVGHAILVPLYYLTSGILIVFDKFFNGIVGIPQGPSWALSIMGLTLVVRTALIPLFVKQIKNSRNMQMLQPKVKELQKKYGHDRERLTQETMKLYKETGTNPLASCMPLILQMPIFMALFRTLINAANDNAVGFLTVAQVKSLSTENVFSTVGLADSFNSSEGWHKGVMLFMVVVMCVTTFTTQRQLMRKNMPDTAMSGQYAQQQKMLLYVLPFVFAIGGIAFPLGVLFYWTTSNLWTMGQQFYVIRNNPTPGTPAAEAKKKRDALRHPQVAAEAEAETPAAKVAEEPVKPKPPQRAQPKKQSRKKRKRR